MLSKNLENSTSYDIFYKFWKKARVYYTLSISRGGGRAPGPPPPGFATDFSKVFCKGSWSACNNITYTKIWLKLF